MDGHEVIVEQDDITQPGFVKIIEAEGMPQLDSSVKGNLYITLKVTIPEFSDQEFTEL